MVKMNHLFRPASLDDIIGQPIQTLRDSMRYPRQGAWLLTGPKGTGKTATTRIVASMLGCEDEWSGFHHVPCSTLNIDEAKELFLRQVNYNTVSGWHLIVLEEMEWLSPQVQRLLKDALDPETNMSKKLIVMGTSNNISNLDEALVDRFRVIEYTGNEEFARSCQEKIRQVWVRTLKSEPPAEYTTWGWRNSTFSMRNAVKCAEDAIQSLLSTV